MTDEDALLVGRWEQELDKMSPLQRRIALALSETCDEWYGPVGDRFVPDVRVISRIAAEVVEKG